MSALSKFFDRILDPRSRYEAGGFVIPLGLLLFMLPEGHPVIHETLITLILFIGVAALTGMLHLMALGQLDADDEAGEEIEYRIYCQQVSGPDVNGDPIYGEAFYLEADTLAELNQYIREDCVALADTSINAALQSLSLEDLEEIVRNDYEKDDFSLSKLVFISGDIAPVGETPIHDPDEILDERFRYLVSLRIMELTASVSPAKGP